MTWFGHIDCKKCGQRHPDSDDCQRPKTFPRVPIINMQNRVRTILRNLNPMDEPEGEFEAGVAHWDAPNNRRKHKMSYSFSVKAANRDDAGKKVEDELAKVVQSQPVHEGDRQAAQDAAEGMIDCVPEPGEGEEIIVNVSGSLGWKGSYPDSHVINSAHVSVSVSVRDKASS